MKHTLKRSLAYLLSVALVVTCAVSGLALPIAAESAETQSTVTNLLANGDFEQGTTGWDDCADMIKEGVGYGGSKGLAYDTHGYSSFATWQGNLALEPHSVYRVTYRYHGAPVCIYPAGTKTDVSDFGLKTATKDYGDWATRIVYFTTGANPVLSSVRFGRTTADTTGTTYIDDVVIEKFTENVNQIVGGDFESHSVSWLEAITNSQVMELVPDPLDATNTVALCTKDNHGYYKYLRLVPARRYRLSFKHYGESLKFQFDKTVGLKTDGSALGGWETTGRHDEWTTVTFEFDTFNQNVVTSNGAYQLIFGYGVGAYIDDVSLVTIPSVTSLTLNASELSLRTGKKYQLTYTMTPADAPVPGGALTWSSDSPDVVSVTADGQLFVRGNAGQSAIITLSNPCISASCTVTIPTDDPAVDAFFKDSGIGTYTVTALNFDKIIASEAAYTALTAAQKEYITELLPVGRDYPDLLAKAKEKQAELAADWANYYACDGAGAPYTAVDFNNCLWIAQAAEEWAAMSDSTKALVNAQVQTASGMTFDRMLADACALLPAREADDEAPEGDDGASAPAEPEDTVEPGKIVSSGSTSITISNDWRDSVEIPDYAYSIAIVGDTQVITDRSPEGLKKIYDWILANKEAKNIQFVAGLGDITEHNTEDEWTIAAEQILRLKGEIPFSVVYGNHDVYNYSTALYNQYLSVDAQFSHLSSDRYGLYEEGKTDNTWQLFEVGDVKYMMITLEFGPSHEVLAWAGEVCDAHPDRNVIITTHAYLDGKGYVMNENHSGSPHIKGGDTYGTTIWEELVSTHDNIVLAFSGHVTADKAMTRQEIGKYGQIVTQTVSNPQTIDDQSMLSGMVTMLYFSEDGTKMTVSDYSTIQEKFYGEPYTVTVDKAQHRHKPSTDQWSADLGSHWYACSCGDKANEAPHAFTAWELTAEDGVQQRLCAICEYTQTLTVPALFTEVELHRANTHVWSYDEAHHWLTCSCGEENVSMDEHLWTAWEQTGTASSASIFREDNVITLSSYLEGAPISNGVGVLDPSANADAVALGDTFAAELKANIIADFEKEGDKMVHVSSFTIIDGMVYMTYYANTATAAESAAHQEARFAYCPVDDPSDMTVITIQKVGDTVEGQKVEMLYDTILMNKDTSEIFIMWTAKTSQYYRFYRVFDVATGELGPIRVNRFKAGDVTNDFSISGVRKALKANGMNTRWMLSDIGIMQKLTSRVEDGVTWYYTGAYIWQFNCIIKSKDLITWEFVAAPDFDNQSEYENATYVLGDKVYYFVRQYDGNSTFDDEGNKVKCATGFLTAYDLVGKTWDAPLEIKDCQSRSDFFYYNGELYLMHAPNNRNGIGFVRIDTENIGNSEAVLVADMQSSCFYPFAMVYGNDLYISYTVNRQHIRLSKVDLSTYFGVNETPIAALPETTPDMTEEEVVEDDLDVWERFCPCGASEYKTLPMGMPTETDTDKNLIYGKIDQNVGLGATEATTVTKTVAVDLKAGSRYALRFTAKGGTGKVELVGITGASVTTVVNDAWRIYQYLFTPTADLTTLDIKFTRTGATRFDAVNIQILEAPQDGTFNLFPGADMSVENAVFGTANAGLSSVYGAGSAHTVDPTDSTNKVVKLVSGRAGYFQLNGTLKGLQLNSDMYLEITFRRTGPGVRLCKNWGANFPTYSGNQDTATASGVWETYTFYVAPGSSDLIYGSGAWGSQHISFYANGANAYIDDIVIREVPRVESVSFKDDTVKVDAATGAHDVSDQLVITPPTACPLDLQNLAWSMTGGTTNKWNPTDKAFNGTEFEAVTMSGTTVTIASPGSNGGMTDLWSLANVKPTITVTVSETVSVSAPIEWVYEDEVFNWDIDNAISMPQSTIDAYVTYENGTDGNKVLSLPTANDFSIYAKKQMFLEPNTRYLISYRSKAVAGDTGRIYAYISTQTGIAPLNSPTGKAILESNNTTGDWVTNAAIFETNDAPAADCNYSIMFQRYGAGTNNVMVDDIRFVKIGNDDSVVLGGDFEFSAPTNAYYDKIIRGGFGTIEEEADGNHVLKLKAGVGRSSSTAIMSMGYLKKNTVYKVTFRYRGGALLFNVAGGNGWAYTISNVPLTKNLPAVSEWTEVEVYFASSSATTNSGNWSSMVQIGTPNATEPVYVDDIVFDEVDAGVYVKAVASAANRPGSLSLSAGSESGNLLTTVKAGSTVRVTAKPNSGYMMVPGSLRYIKRDGTEVKILNKSMSALNFGKGDGTVYEFVLPEDHVGITADFVSTADTSVGFDTIGTSLRVGAGGDNYDGIRFLNRMYFGDGFDANFETLTVRHGGVEYEVIEIGSLLKRSENATDLTLANVEAALSLSGVNRMWKSVAYQAGGNMSVVDYTGSYIDFSVVMLRGASVSEEVFNARSYTARGYMKLEAADGTVITVECDNQLTNSIDTTAPLL